MKGSWQGQAQLHESQLVLAFGARFALEDPEIVARIEAEYPRALLVGCSTAGEILGTRVYDDSVVVTALVLERTLVQGGSTQLRCAEESHAAGRRLAASLSHDGLRHVLVFCEGLQVNGSELARGLEEGLPDRVSVTGGLAGDGADFMRTSLLSGSGSGDLNAVVVGFYGDTLRIGYASLGGWDPFGPDRIITRSKANVLYELDGQPALTVYKRYLGEHASGLPATGLLFPLSLKFPESTHRVVRTILSVCDDEGSMTFAGDVPQGIRANLMKANFNRLIDGAHGAAVTSCVPIPDSDPDLAILISCVGRKLVLKQRVEDEVEAVRSVVGARTALAGFYSYGEISPFSSNGRCELHNQTMTITTFKE